MTDTPKPATTLCEYEPPRAPGDARYTKRKCTTHLVEFWETGDCPVNVVYAALRERLRVAEALNNTDILGDGPLKRAGEALHEYARRTGGGSCPPSWSGPWRGWYQSVARVAILGALGLPPASDAAPKETPDADFQRMNEESRARWEAKRNAE